MVYKFPLDILYYLICTGRAVHYYPKVDINADYVTDNFGNSSLITDNYSQIYFWMESTGEI